jgi:SPRY domain-containing SOCS box protein 3
MWFFSSGTAAVRGDKPLSLNMHHYWELRMGSVLYGTDVSVGVGTKNVCYNSHTTRFVTLLGLDGNSWG